MDEPAYRPSHLTEILRDTPLFRAVGAEALAFVVSNGVVERRDAGALICQQGERSENAFVLLDGDADVVIETDADRRHVAVLKPHHVIGEIGLACDLPRTATVLARSDCTLLRIPRTTFRSMILQHPEMAFAIIGNLGLRLQEVSRALAYFTTAADTLSQNAVQASGVSAQLPLDFGQLGSVSAPLLDTYARLAAEIERKQQHRQEMAIAARIQRAMLPPARAIPVPVQVAARLQPAQDVGGDFYDYFMLPNGQLAFLIADVSGKGVPAALMMAVACTTLRSLAPDFDQPGACVERANAVLTENNPESMFLTAVYAVLDAARGLVRFTNAGHGPVLVQSATGAVQALETHNAAIGLLPEMAYATQELQLQPGDTVFLGTDGIVEAVDPAGEQFGEERLLALLRTCEPSRPEALVERVMGAVQAFSSPVPFDDITCLALTYRPG